MNFFGAMQPACGVMALEVHPLHKKKGAALYMIRYAERYARENGALLTMLLPFNIGFYRRMGYGFGGKLYEYHLPTGARRGWTEEVPGAPAPLQPEEFDQAMACQRRFAARNHGMVEKFDEELRGARGDIQVRRMGYYDGGRLLGYAAYRFESASACNYTQNRLSVEELVYENGTVLRALLGGLRMQEDLAQTVILRTGEEDFHHLLDDPQGRVRKLHRLRLFADQCFRRGDHVQADGRGGLRAADRLSEFPGGDADGGLPLSG